MENEKIMELAYFELKNVSDEEEFLAISKIFKKDFLDKQVGLIDRKLMRFHQQWCVVAYWDNLEYATNTIKKMSDDKLAQQYLSYMNLETVKIEYLYLVQE